MGDVVHGPFAAVTAENGIEARLQPRRADESLYDFLTRGCREMAAEMRALRLLIENQRDMLRERRETAARRLCLVVASQAWIASVACVGAGKLLGIAIWPALLAGIVVATATMLGGMVLIRCAPALDRALLRLRRRWRGRPS